MSCDDEGWHPCARYMSLIPDGSGGWAWARVTIDTSRPVDEGSRLRAAFASSVIAEALGSGGKAASTGGHGRA